MGEYRKTTNSSSYKAASYIRKKEFATTAKAGTGHSQNRLYDQIMEQPNSQHFYRLIKRNRGSTINGTNCIKQDGKYLFLPKDQRKCFAEYYEDLSKPKTDSFDNTYICIGTL